MSEEIKAVENKEESFEELLNQSFKTLNTGEKVTGIVTAITPTEYHDHDVRFRGENGRFRLTLMRSGTYCIKFFPVIIGDAAHPEVAGIASWCGHPLIFSGPEAVDPKSAWTPRGNG